MLGGVALAGAGIIPVDCAAFDVVWQYLMPMAAACFLLETDIPRLLSSGGPTLLSFLIGSVGMVLGALAGWALLSRQLGPDGWKVVACLCASYVGGSINFAAVASVVELPASAIPAAMAADNLAMAGYLAVLMAVPVTLRAAAPAVQDSGSLQQQQQQQPVPLAEAAVAGGSSCSVGFPVEAHPRERPAQQSGSASGRQLEEEHQQQVAPPPTSQPAGPSGRPAVTAESLSLTFAAAAVACAASKHAAEALNCKPLTLMLMALIAASLGTLGTWVRRVTAGVDAMPFTGASQVGTMLMMVFFAVIGASAGSLSCLASCGWLVAFLTIMVAVHWLVVAAAGSWLRLPREALLLGSNACIGGPATAAGMAAAKGWSNLVQPAMLTGSLGYAIGTAAGLAVAKYAQRWTF